MVDFLGSNMLLWFLPLRSNDNEPNQDLEVIDGKVLPLQRILGHYYEPFSDQTIDLIEKRSPIMTTSPHCMHMEIDISNLQSLI